MIRCSFFIICFLWLFTVSAVGTDYFVPKDYPTIQQAIDNCQDNDSVILASGVYTGEGNREIVFNGKRVIVRSVDPDDPEVVKTTVIDCQSSLEEQYRAFDLRDNGPYSPVIGGLTITNASICVNAKNGNVILLNCRLVSNKETAVKVNGCNAVIRNCSILSNAGVGIDVSYGASSVISNCLIKGNRKGGILIKSQADIFESQIIENHNRRNGGGIYIDGDNVRIINCVIKNNQTGKSGGGFYLSSGKEEYLIDGCIIDGNTAKESGGGIRGAGMEDNIKIINCKILNNKAGKNGGGIAYLKGLISGCEIKGNTAERGGDVSQCQTIEKCTFSLNHTTDAATKKKK